MSARKGSRSRSAVATVARCVELLRKAGLQGMNTRALAVAAGVSEHWITQAMGKQVKRGSVRMHKRHRAPAMWYVEGKQPDDRESVLAVGKALTVKTRERLVLDHNQATIVPESVRVVVCPVRWA